MLLLPLLSLFLLFSGTPTSGTPTSGKEVKPDPDKKCKTSLGVEKDPCPPCAPITHTYMTMEKEIIIDQAEDVPPELAPRLKQWIQCYERSDSANSFSPYGAEQKEFNKVWINPDDPKSYTEVEVEEETDPDNDKDKANVTSTEKPDNTSEKPDNASEKPDNASEKPDTTTEKADNATEKPDTTTEKPKKTVKRLKEKYDVDITLLYQPPAFCDIQVVRCPSEKVLGCKDKMMLAHEDEYRRQCKETFVKNFEYEIKAGSFDPELADYWLKNDADFVSLDENGNLKVTYDYTTFGCPIEPYQEDDFAPDLRILTANMNRNTSLGLRYNNSYILIEIFGTAGFLQEGEDRDEGYSWKYDDNKGLCTGKPQRLFDMIKIWKDEPFDPKATARDPLNIWKDFKSCNDTNDTDTKTPQWKSGSYEIMNNRKYDAHNKTNKMIWNTENQRPETLIFLAISVDDPDCTYYTLFGVSLPKPTELNSLNSLYWFIFFTLLWLLLVVLGYYWRKAIIRRQYFEEARSERLKQSAWAVIYRYEKLLHESENKQIEEEMTDYYRHNSESAQSAPDQAPPPGTASTTKTKTEAKPKPKK